MYDLVAWELVRQRREQMERALARALVTRQAKPAAKASPTVRKGE